MKVNQSGVWSPLAQHPVDMVIVRRSLQPQPSMEIFLCSDIIARKLMNPSEAAQQRVFSGPTSHSSQLHQPVYCLSVIHGRETIEVELAFPHCSGCINDGLSLASAISKRSQRLDLDLVQIIGTWERTAFVGAP